MGAITGIGLGLAVGATLALAHDDRGHGAHRESRVSGGTAREAHPASA
jgi:hypothetical protein